MPKISKEKTLNQVIRFLIRNSPQHHGEMSEEYVLEEEKSDFWHYGWPSYFSIFAHEKRAIERLIKMLSAEMLEGGEPIGESYTCTWRDMASGGCYECGEEIEQSAPFVHQMTEDLDCIGGPWCIKCAVKYGFGEGDPKRKFHFHGAEHLVLQGGVKQD